VPSGQNNGVESNPNVGMADIRRYDPLAVWTWTSHCALVNQGGALFSTLDDFQLIGQPVPKRQPAEALMTLDRGFES